MENQVKSISMQAADNIRLLAAAMVEKAKSGHPGGAMGGADFMHILYSEYLTFDPDDTTYPHRDRFFLDPGHMSAMLYGQLALFGNYSLEEISNFRQWGSPTPGHPEIDLARGIENTSGPLGLGHTFGIGAAIAERFLEARFGKVVEHKTFLYISDGGIQEEIAQGAGRTAGFLGLGNVVMFYDANDVQLSTTVEEVMTENTAMKYEAWGWHVITIDGNDHDAIRKALDAGIAETDKPTLIIGQTVMGKGIKKADGGSFEGQVESHGKPIGKSKGDYAMTVEGLGGDVNNPFVIFDDVAEHYEAVKAKNRKAIAARKADYAKWASANAAQATKLEGFFKNEAPKLDYAAIPQTAGKATRDGSGAVLAYLADNVENMVVASADLSNSDKTDNFLKKTTHFQKNDFNGSFLQAGVSELTMASLMIGMSLHGGVIPACATFFAFSDYMKPAIRVAALMEVPVIFIWTHDAFRVGEDGPTHQPVEQETQIRLLEKLQNHSHKNSMLVLRPADVNESTVAWKMALENLDTPTGLILSRQGIPNLPNSTYELALRTEKGGYIVEDTDGTPDVILVANGSEVSTLVDSAAILRSENGLKVRVVSVPSEGVFRKTSADYQESVLPANVPTFGLTAGLPVNLQGLVGVRGKVFGLSHFGYSAPYTVLDEKFGFTPANVQKQVLDLLK
jgi:transketolase